MRHNSVQIALSDISPEYETVVDRATTIEATGQVGKNKWSGLASCLTTEMNEVGTRLNTIPTANVNVSWERSHKQTQNIG